MAANQVDKKADSRAFLYTFSLFFISGGIYLSYLSDKMIYHSLTVIGAILLLYSFIEKTRAEYHEEDTRKRNIIWGVVIFILAIIIVWITFENRFNLETMAKTKSI